jgi:penicillin amidase
VIRRVAAVVGVGLALILGAGLIGTTFLVMGPLPSRRGRILIPGLKASAESRFDRQGVPHVRAVLETDAWRVLGFVHAADRLFQMELRRRAAQGRLSELFGAATVALDREARINGYLVSARRDLGELQEHERAALEAYADGVNAFLAEEVLPLEIRALSYTPEPWTPVDSLAFARLMESDLSVAQGPEAAAFDDALARGLDEAVRLMQASEPGELHIARETAGSWPASGGRRVLRLRLPNRHPRGATRGPSPGDAPPPASRSWRETLTWPPSVLGSGTRPT